MGITKVENILGKKIPTLDLMETAKKYDTKGHKNRKKTII